MMDLPASPPALRMWLGLGLFMLLCLGIGQALEKKVVKSKVGEKVSLPCCHEIPSSESLHKYRVYWQKNITDVVLAYSEGNKIFHHERYQNRTEMDPWNLTLWISPMEILDNGSYQCVVQRNSVLVCSESVILFVTADFSTPNITTEVSAESCELTEMVITCSSHGGFPKPKISGALNNVSMEWNASWVSESSFSPYSVTGKLVLNVTKDVNISCSVEYSGFAKSSSLLLKKTNSCVVPPVPPSYNVIIASIIILIIFILAITLAARYLPRHVCSQCCKHQDSVEEGVKEYTKAPMSSKVTSETSSV
ncbi:T-lymphocyte activation antigen CD80-like [Passer montanus]|uniref:T-lymphocyte activation antigen CD80-like n=1 Tax=Passer montanus TaxID=9160 RepID=UPI00196226AE|nr:T-lymphocyte activation antigen CD80-like [Passer montanus]XP_039569149.1 T-lymphocyte activation antigen CD80-like [Passer montanus]